MEKSKNDVLVGLVAQSRTVEPAAFLSLIKKNASLLRKEQKDQKTKRDSGRLLRIAPSGAAIIMGDLHGDLASLTYILKDSDFVRRAQMDKDIYLIFLGDYGDRGLHSPEVYFVVLKLKELFPERVVLMRGNHEGPDEMIPCPYDLPEQFKKKFGDEVGEKIITELRKLFKRFYTSVIIEKRAVLAHGGLPSCAKSIEDLVWAHKRHPEDRALEELLWSDPEDYLAGTTLSPRGAGRLFGADVTKRLLKMLNVNFLVRSHEFCEEGFKINHNGKVLTLFSTNEFPYGNRYAAYLQLNLSANVKSARSLTKYIRQFE